MSFHRPGISQEWNSKPTEFHMDITADDAHGYVCTLNQSEFKFLSAWIRYSWHVHIDIRY